ncbi:MAG: DNA polymerase II large subunit [Candidatus Helarchaeota archaeon]|nr:DNA polymerase II large subunit [Candidatus Helarchaeota archaeon]
MSTNIKDYFLNLKSEIEKLYEIANRARGKGYDPSNAVEIPWATDVASRVEKLIGPQKVASRIRKLINNKLDHEKIAFKIAEEIALGEFGLETREQRADQAIRTALGILTEGITAAPIDGIANVEIKQNFDKTEYLAISFSGPIRSAGGTETALTILIGDIVRKILHLSKYKPTEREVERYLEEINLYKNIMSLQFPSKPDEIKYAATHIPIEITGEPTQKEEVTGHRDLPRIKTNRVRGGAVLVFNDGLLGKAHKLKRIILKSRIEGWEWINKLVSHKPKVKEREIDVKPKTKFLEDVIAGRPIFAYPSRKGGFRLRYGRSRNTGLAAVGLNPATMIIGTDSFIATGTQFITERPGKGSIVMPVDSIEGPLVKLKNGSIKRINSIEEANRFKSNVKEIISQGDCLIAFGEFLENDHVILPSADCEEWWGEELKSVTKKFPNLNSVSKMLNISSERLEKFIQNPLKNKPTQKEAIIISKNLDISLHPIYNYSWNDISKEEFIFLRNLLIESNSRSRPSSTILIQDYDEKAKILLEKIEIPHQIEDNKIIFSDNSLILEELLQLNNKSINIQLDLIDDDCLKIIESISNIKVKIKAPYYIGARMGRPEKSKERKMNPPVHGLFPIGRSGGTQRDLIKAAFSRKEPFVEVVTKKCSKCNEITYENLCPRCNVRTSKVMICSKCNIEIDDDMCKCCGAQAKFFSKKHINLNKLLSKKLKLLKVLAPEKVKCVIGLISRNKVPEMLEKGILRAKHNTFVFKDGTCRHDATDAPLTHFKPFEIGTSLEKLKELGYKKDYKGVELTSKNQIVELRVQDIVISYKSAEYLMKVSKFIDDLLEKIYNLPKFYNIKDIKGLLGHIVIGLAPHISAGIVGRIIGFTESNVLFAHPYWHAGKRRNCDSDEDAIILALDALINFSIDYLPATRGGVMDAPLILTLTINPDEIDDEVYNMEVVEKLPLLFYDSTINFPSPKDVRNIIDIVDKRRGSSLQYEGFKFSHDTTNINFGPKETKYKKLKSMKEKVEAQLDIAKKIRAVDVKDTAKRIIEKHFLRDIIGNLRAFANQSYRCPKCNKIYRRIPLSGHCNNKIKDNPCKGKLILTVTKGGIIKYLQIAIDIAKKYELDQYLKQRLELAEEYVDSIFESSKDKGRQTSIMHFTNL